MPYALESKAAPSPHLLPMYNNDSIVRTGYSWGKEKGSLPPRPAFQPVYKLSKQDLPLKFFSTIGIMVFWILKISILFLITRIDF